LGATGKLKGGLLPSREKVFLGRDLGRASEMGERKSAVKYSLTKIKKTVQGNLYVLKTNEPQPSKKVEGLGPGKSGDWNLFAKLVNLLRSQVGRARGGLSWVLGLKGEESIQEQNLPGRERKVRMSW